MVSDITEARYRQRAGLPLEPRHVDAIRRHDSKYATNKVTIHVQKECIDEWKAEAAKTGTSLSTYVWTMVEHARGPNPLVQELEAHKIAAEAENAALRGVIASLTDRTVKMEAQLYKMQDAMAKVLGGPGRDSSRSG